MLKRLDFALLIMVLLALVALPVAAQDDIFEESTDELETIEVQLTGFVTSDDDAVYFCGVEIAPASAFAPGQVGEDELITLTVELREDGTLKGITQDETAEDATEGCDLPETDECDPETDECEDPEEPIECDPEIDECDEEEATEGACRLDQPITIVLSEEFEVESQEIADLRCEGFGYGEIARAYLLEQALADTEDAEAVADILARRGDGEGWGQILRDYPDVSPSDLAPGRVIGKGKGKPVDADAPADANVNNGNNGNGNGNGNGNNGNGNGNGNNGNNGNGNGNNGNGNNGGGNGNGNGRGR